MEKLREGGRTAVPAAERWSDERLDSVCHETAQLLSDKPRLAPRRLLILLVVSIFLANVLNTFLHLHVQLMLMIPIFYEELIDALALLIILSPTFYFFHYRPLMVYHRERNEIIEQLCHSEERLTLALNAVNDGLWDWNVLTGEVYASARSSTMLGFLPGELGNKIEAWGKRLHPGDRRKVDRLFKEHLEGKSDYYYAEHRLRHKKGRYLWVLARGQVVARSLDNQPLRMIGTYTDITQRKAAEDALRRSEEDIRNLSRQMMQSSEEEKKLLAQDLHDEFGQVLCAFQLGVEMLRDHNYGPPDQYKAQCERLLSLVERLEVDLRKICDHLRPVMLDDLGLQAALKWLLEQFAAQHPEVKTTFAGLDSEISAPHEKEITVYRICQEALNNVSKYARASRVGVDLKLSGNLLTLFVQDNGVGFSEEELRRKPGPWGMGLLGMRERAAAVGGEMRVASAPGQGTKIQVTLAIEPAAVDLTKEVAHESNQDRSGR